MATATDRVTRSATRLAMRHADAMSQSTLVPPTVEALIEAEALVARQRRLAAQAGTLLYGTSTVEQRRRRKELAERRLLDPARAGVPGAPAVWWHEDGSGPTVLLLNGWTASGLLWPAAFVGPLAADHRVIRIDNRGTGWSRTVPGALTIRAMADDAADVLRATDSAPAVVVGLSMGGMIAQELTLRHPQLVSALVLAGTRPPAPAHVQAAPAVLAGVLAEPSPGTPAERSVGAMWAHLCGPGFGARHPDRLDELVEQVRRRVTPAAAVNAQMRAIAAWSGPRRLRRITCPTVVVHGDHDRLMPVGNGMRLSRLVPGAEYVELPGVGHLVPMEAPERLVAIVDRLSAAASRIG